MLNTKVKKSETKSGKREWSPDTTIAAVNDVESTNVTDTTPDNKALLAKQESVIASNVGAFLLLGEALSIIKAGNLQTATDTNLSFDEYCSKKWGFGKAYAYRLINSFECVQHLKKQMAPNKVTVFPANEAQVRPLTGLSPEKQVQAWSDVLKKANGGNVTAAIVDEIVEGLAGNASKSETDADSKIAVTKADHRKLKTIAKLVEKTRQIDPAKLNLKKLLKVLEQIEKLLKDE